MLLGLVTVGVIGILLGFRARTPALIVVTALTVVVSAVAGGTGGFVWHRLLSILLLVVTLQCTYLLGLFLGVVLRHGMSRKQ